MSTQKNGAANTYGTTPHQQDSVGKGTTFPRHLQEVLAVLVDGNEYTAKQINILTSYNDARESISDLIRLGVPIQKRFAHGNRYKLYWLDSKNKTCQQAELFPTADAEKKGGQHEE